MSNSESTPTNTVGPVTKLDAPVSDGVLSIRDRYGKCVLQLDLSGESNSAHLTLTVGTKRYTLDIQPTPGLGTVDPIKELEAGAFRALVNNQDNRLLP